LFRIKGNDRTRGRSTEVRQDSAIPWSPTQAVGGALAEVGGSFVLSLRGFAKSRSGRQLSLLCYLRRRRPRRSQLPDCATR
jgi:hypothetical protein